MLRLKLKVKVVSEESLNVERVGEQCEQCFGVSVTWEKKKY